MIFTVTFNPSLDYHITLDALVPGSLNRAKTERMVPGGKGINVSLVLQALGHPSRILGFSGGFTGAELSRALTELELYPDLVEASGQTRVNVKVHADVETEINGQGCTVTENDLEKIVETLKMSKLGDWVIVSGASAAGLPTDSAARLLTGREGVYTCADVSGTAFDTVLRAHPFLVKPNRAELSEWAGQPLDTSNDVANAAAAAQRRGARNVLVSLGAGGAFLLCEDGTTHSGAAPQGSALNTVGAGDAMLAGFVAGFIETGRLDGAFQLGLAAGSAAAFAPWMPGGESIRALHAGYFT